MATMQNVIDAVTKEDTVAESIIILLDGISKQIKTAQASNDPAVMDKVVADIQSHTQALQDAIVANTPVVVVPSDATSVPAGTPIVTGDTVTEANTKQVPVSTK